MSKMRADWKKIALQLFPDYKGRKFFEASATKIAFNNTNWSGGTRTQYKAHFLPTGKTGTFEAPAPWANPVEGMTTEIPAGLLIFTRAIFCGHECGITVYFRDAYIAQVETPGDRMARLQEHARIDTQELDRHEAEEGREA